LRGPRTQTPAYPTTIDPPLSKSEPLRTSFVKAGPLWLGFRFSTPNSPPSRGAGLWGPRTQTPAYPAPIDPALSESKVPRTSFKKFEPQQLHFRFSAPNALPLRAAGLHGPGTQTPAYLAPIDPQLFKSEAPRTSFGKIEPPRLGFWFLAPNTPPLARR
jgi:hypothetical protein